MSFSGERTRYFMLYAVSASGRQGLPTYLGSTWNGCNAFSEVSVGAFHVKRIVSAIGVFHMKQVNLVDRSVSRGTYLGFQKAPSIKVQFVDLSDLPIDHGNANGA